MSQPEVKKNFPFKIFEYNSKSTSFEMIKFRIKYNYCYFLSDFFKK